MESCNSLSLSTGCSARGQAVESDGCEDSTMTELLHYAFKTIWDDGNFILPMIMPTRAARLCQIPRPNFLRNSITTRTRIASPSLCGARSWWRTVDFWLV